MKKNNMKNITISEYDPYSIDKDHILYPETENSYRNWIKQIENDDSPIGKQSKKILNYEKIKTQAKKEELFEEFSNLKVEEFPDLSFTLNAETVLLLAGLSTCEQDPYGSNYYANRIGDFRCCKLNDGTILSSNSAYNILAIFSKAKFTDEKFQFKLAGVCPEAALKLNTELSKRTRLLIIAKSPLLIERFENTSLEEELFAYGLWPENICSRRYEFILHVKNPHTSTLNRCAKDITPEILYREYGAFTCAKKILENKNLGKKYRKFLKKSIEEYKRMCDAEALYKEVKED